MSGRLRKIGRSRVIKLPDGRKQVIDRSEVFGSASDPASIDTEVFIAFGTAHPKYTSCLLIQQSPLDFSGDQQVEQTLTRVYEELHATAETQVGKTRRVESASGVYYEASFIQLSSASATPGTMGVTAAPDYASSAMVYESATSDGALRRITRRYSAVNVGGTAGTPVAIGSHEIDNPLAPLEATAKTIRQRYRQLRSGYSYPSENATCPIAGFTGAGGDPAGDKAFFCEDSPRASVGGEVVEWVRLWATKPLTYDDWDDVGATFPAWFLQREPASQTVTVKIIHTAYLIGTSGDYATVGEIPVVPESRMTFASGGDVPLLSAGGVLNNGGAGVDVSTPTLTAYKALVAADAGTPASFSVVSRASKPVRFQGNIWLRREPRVKAI